MTPKFSSLFEREREREREISPQLILLVSQTKTPHFTRLILGTNSHHSTNMIGVYAHLKEVIRYNHVEQVLCQNEVGDAVRHVQLLE